MADELDDLLKQQSDQAQRALNESKKQELKEKFGMGESYINPDIDPAVEGEFLDHIVEFEKQWATAEPMTVWEFIGKPDFRPSSEVKDSELSTEIDRL